MRLFTRFQPAQRAQALQWAHVLRSMPLFSQLPAADLAAIMDALGTYDAPTGTEVCRRGEPGDALYLIQSGELEVRLGLGPAGIVLRRLGPGDFVGEMSLFTGEPRSADVVATRDSVLWTLARADFDLLLDRRPSLSRAFNRALCERLAHVTRQLERQALGDDGPSGLRFGPYRVVEQLGVGGMAAVYSAVHEGSEAAVAVKVLPAAWGAAPEFRERLLREADALRQVQHPNVVRVLDVGEVEGRLGGGCYLALEWVPHALDRVMRAQFPDPLSPPTALRIAGGVAEGLAAVHAAGLVHRDVKPSNILLRMDGSPVVTDLGLVAALRETAGVRRLTPTNTILGTADYIAPEQVQGTAVDGRCDLYALGVVLFEMLSGMVPFAGHDPLSTVRAKLAQPAPSLPGEHPQALRALVARALEREPDDRFQTAGEMAAALAACRAA